MEAPSFLNALLFPTKKAGEPGGSLWHWLAILNKYIH